MTTKLQSWAACIWTKSHEAISSPKGWLPSNEELTQTTFRKKELDFFTTHQRREDRRNAIGRSSSEEDAPMGEVTDLLEKEDILVLKGKLGPWEHHASVSTASFRPQHDPCGP
ncbi:hypothetical protein BHM03_00033712 [Ensete ventricosum]|nr:hypothetical protein BHM03_00033712 [Ensete ventricosum]